MLAPDVANMYLHKISLRQPPLSSSGTASAAPSGLIPAFGSESETPHAFRVSPPFRQPPASTSAALRNFGITLPTEPSGIRPAAYATPASASGPWSEKFVTKCPTFRYAPHIGKLPLAAALSPIL